MKEQTREHRGYTMTAVPRQDNAVWAIDLTISRGKESWLISAGEQAVLDDEAFETCFTFGREVIEKELKS